MRRPAVVLMSGISATVVGLSLQHSQLGDPARQALRPAGVVGDTGPSPRTSPALSAPSAAAAEPTSPSVPSPRASKVIASRPPAARPKAVPSRAVATASARPAPAPTARATATAAARTVTVNGAAADTRYGPVQVQITLRGGHIVRADAVDYPQGGGRDQQINSQAVPQLDDETVRADSAQIDTVSGATYTSDGYRQSLQSALDAAHRAGAR